MGVLAPPYRDVIGEPFPVPYLDVQLLGRRRVYLRALVDSGAVRPIFPTSAAEDAGIDLSKSVYHPIQYGGSISPGWIGRARIDVNVGKEIRTLDLSIVFVERLDLPYVLLGRIGFFDQFNEVAFLQKVAPSQLRLTW
jgi:hypothetical protein